jgi:hypothetical protein
MIKANKNNGGEGDIDVNDSFVANERRAQQMSLQDRNKLIHDKIF